MMRLQPLNIHWICQLNIAYNHTNGHEASQTLSHRLFRGVIPAVRRLPAIKDADDFVCIFVAMCLVV